MPLASRHRAQSRRRRDLVAIFLDALGGRAAVSELQLVRVRMAAELTTAAEAVRARVLAGDAAMDLELLVKIEGEARRAVRALNLKTAAKRGPTFAEVVARIAAEEALGGPEPYTSGTRPYPSKPSKSGFEGFEGADP